MPICKIKDIIYRVKDKVSIDCGLKYYVAGEHFDSNEVIVEKKGNIEGSTIGPAFHMRFKPGQVLLMSRNPHLRKAGLVNFEGICSDVSYVCETKDETKFKQNLIPFLFQSDIFWKKAEENKRGSTNFFLNWSDFEEFEINIPKPTEQEYLCNLLWAGENVRQQYKKLLQKTDDIIKAKFIEMFGIPGSKNNLWEYTSLSKCCILNPKKINLGAETECSFVPMSSVDENGNVNASIIKRYKDVSKGFTFFENNDVLFAKITPCMENGKGGIAKNLKNGIGFGSTEFHVLRPIEGISNPYWIYIITMFPQFRTSARNVMTGTGGQLRVPISFLDDYKISRPPIELQNKFAEFVEQAEQAKQQLKLSLDSLNKMIKSIVQESFN